MRNLIISIILVCCYLVVWGQNESIIQETFDRYAVVIGISNYEDSTNNLSYSKKDAMDFKDALVKFGNFDIDNIKLLVDKDATRENIRKNIEGWLKSKANKNDIVVIYFSGHGSQVFDSDNDESDGLDECLIPYDFDNEDISTIIIDDIFAYWINNLQSEKVIIVFDNCYSGGAAKQKGVSLKGVKGNIGKDDFSKDIKREVPRQGTALFSGSKADQVSFESKDFQNGIFTHFLLEAITFESDNNFNNSITINELFEATRKKTLEYTKKKFRREQEPTLINDIDTEVDLFYLPVKKKKMSNINYDALMHRIDHENNKMKRILLLEELHVLDPNKERVCYKLAETYESVRNYSKAIEFYNKVLSIHDKGEKGLLDKPSENGIIRFSGWSYSTPIEVSIAKLYQEIGDNDKAESYLSKVVSQDNLTSQKCNILAEEYISLKDTLMAIRLLNRSINKEKYQVSPYLDLFYLHLAKGNLEVCKDIIDKSYSLNPFDSETIYWFAQKEKSLNNHVLGDSLLLQFENKSGISDEWSKINEKYPPNQRFALKKSGKMVEDHLISEEQFRYYLLVDAINKYPYYLGFYKYTIKHVSDNKLNENTSKYIKKYRLYSKLAPEIDFVSKYCDKH